MRRWIWSAIGAGVMLLAVAIALAFDNPTIDHTDEGTYQCFAPYDTILLGDRNEVGMHTDAFAIERRCLASNRSQFIWACIFAGAGAAAGVMAAVLVVRRRRPGSV